MRVIAATVATAIAQIGGAHSAWKSGVISYDNTRAGAAGIALGEDLLTFVDKTIAAN